MLQAAVLSLELVEYRLSFAWKEDTLLSVCDLT